jgi:hypothetical protein
MQPQQQNNAAQVNYGEDNDFTRLLSKQTTVPGFENEASFELLMRQAKLWANNNLVPVNYRSRIEKKNGNETTFTDNPNAIANCCIAINIATRLKADILMVMQNLYVIEGRPSWSSLWIIAALNSCVKFSPVRFELKDLGQREVTYTVTKWDNSSGRGVKKEIEQKQIISDKICIAYVIEKATGERLDSAPVSMEMAIQEGWYQKNGSKWQTMPDLMLRYRSAAFLGKLYAPELLMGMQTVEELEDISADYGNLSAPSSGYSQPNDSSDGVDEIIERINDSSEPDELALIKSEIDGMSGESRKKAVKAYTKRMNYFKEQAKQSAQPIDNTPLSSPEPTPPEEVNAETGEISTDHLDWLSFLQGSSDREELDRRWLEVPDEYGDNAEMVEAYKLMAIKFKGGA